uniref:Major sperm protein n=1 Tax=Ditylenchus dipsaci TaxID=166011 RepID=A0A915E3U4_9BILA
MNPFIELRPGEPPFQMKLDPDDFITFKGETMTACPVDFDVNVTNTTKVRQACKVKCTSNAIFRAWPPHSFIQPGETLPIKLSLICSTIPDPSKHFFAFVHVAAPETEEKKTPKGFWTPNTKHDGSSALLFNCSSQMVCHGLLILNRKQLWPSQLLSRSRLYL